MTGRERANVDLLRAAIGMPDADASEVAAAIAREREAVARAETEKRTNDALTIENLQLAAKAGI